MIICLSIFSLLKKKTTLKTWWIIFINFQSLVQHRLKSIISLFCSVFFFHLFFILFSTFFCFLLDWVFFLIIIPFYLHSWLISFLILLFWWFPLILSLGSSFKCMCWLGLSWIPSGNPLEFSRAPTPSSSFLSASKSCSCSQLGLPSSWFCLNSGMIPGSTWDPCPLAWNLSGKQALRVPLSGIPPLRDRWLSFIIGCPMSWKPLLAQGTRVGGGRAPKKGVGWSRHRGPESEGSE